MRTSTPQSVAAVVSFGILRSLLEAEKMDQNHRLALVGWQSLNRVENLFPENLVFGIASDALKVGKPGQNLIVEFLLDQGRSRRRARATASGC